MFNRTPQEIEDIIKLANKRKIKLSGELFIRKSYETDKLITLLKRKNVPFTPIVLERTYEEAKQIIEYVQNKEIKVAAI